MLISIDREHHNVAVERQEGDPVFHNSKWASAESTFLYHIKKQLQSVGYDCIKKRMWKDGHLVDDEQQYIRDRKGEWCIYNDAYAIYDAGEKFNQNYLVYLRYEDWK
jgi:hypothetical protein